LHLYGNWRLKLNEIITENEKIEEEKSIKNNPKKDAKGGKRLAGFRSGKNDIEKIKKIQNGRVRNPGAGPENYSKLELYPKSKAPRSKIHWRLWEKLHSMEISKLSPTSS